MAVGMCLGSGVDSKGGVTGEGMKEDGESSDRFGQGQGDHLRYDTYNPRQKSQAESSCCDLS